MGGFAAQIARSSPVLFRQVGDFASPGCRLYDIPIFNDLMMTQDLTAGARVDGGAQLLPSYLEHGCTPNYSVL